MIVRVFRAAALLVATMFAIPVRAAEWQWSTAISTVVSSETKDHPRAFLWIPPDCKQVRGIVVGQHNMEEEPILEHPKFRAALTELGFAEIWVTPGFDLFFRFDRGADEHFNAMMEALADVSGYIELKTVPIVPMGHSAAASFPWNFGALHPERTLAILSVSGQWPYFKDENTPDWGNRTVDGIPGLVSMGEYEAAESRAGEGLKQRREHPAMPLSMLANPGGGHFESSDEKVKYLALYLKKAVQYRLPADVPPDGPVKLRDIDPTTQGWLADRWRKDQSPRAAAAPVGQYKGDPKDAFWFFDEELARATATFQARDSGKKVDLLGFIQDGKIVEQDPKTHQQVTLSFQPLADGVSFHLDGAFLDAVPPGRPEGWTGLRKGSPVKHAAGGGPIVINRICGPVVQTGPTTWTIQFYRMGMTNTRRSNEIWLFASHRGDEQYRRAVQQAVLRFPLRNNEGADQAITFPEIPDQKAGVKSLKLAATSDRGVPVSYYVREGPAEIADDELTFTAIPPRAKFPIKVTIVAWQYGRMLEPKIKTAEAMERSFFLTQP